MKHETWKWGSAGRMLERANDDGCEYLWINARPPPPAERARYGFRLEIICWFDDDAALNEGLEIVRDYFYADSFLAAIRRRDTVTRVLLFTAAREPVVDERYANVREVLRPTFIGRRVAIEPTWESLAALEEEFLSEHAAGSAFVGNASNYP